MNIPIAITIGGRSHAATAAASTLLVLFLRGEVLGGCIGWPKINKKSIFDPQNMKKPHQKVAYLSRNSVVSEIFLFLPNSPNGRIHVPKCPAQMWPIEQLYIELGCLVNRFLVTDEKNIKV